jgi:CHAD domain-containing protein
MEADSHMLTSELLDKSLTVANFSQQVVDQLSRKIFHEKTTILQDSDPEILHKMRVKMRRLRTVLRVLEPLLILPRNFTPSSIGKLANVLGAVRDIDVMGELLQKAREQEIPDREQQILAKVASSLTHHRKKARAKMEQHVHRNYREFVIAGQTWLDRPQYHHQHTQLIIDVLPDLLPPIIGAFFLHEGWLVTAEELSNSQAILHDLRKCTKRIRYQTECFFPYLNADYARFLPPLEATQEYLGQMQDISVLRNFISKSTNKKLAKNLPITDDRLDQKMQQAWQDWQPIKLQLSDRHWRQSLRCAAI